MHKLIKSVTITTANPVKYCAVNDLKSDNEKQYFVWLWSQLATQKRDINSSSCFCKWCKMYDTLVSENLQKQKATGYGSLAGLQSVQDDVSNKDV